MSKLLSRIGIIVTCWDSLRRNAAMQQRFLDLCYSQGDAAFAIISLTPTIASPLVLRDVLPQSYVTDSTQLSPARLSYRVDQLYYFDGNELITVPVHKRATVTAPRLGLVASNGFGLGHVMRIQSLAQAFADAGDIAILSFSAGLLRHEHYPVSHLASAEYLKLSSLDALAYTREATLRFINQFSPTHMLYDGNVLPPGMLAAIASRPEIHLTWLRRGMWRDDVKPSYMAQQALADLVIEPGDLADSYDTGPTWQKRHEYFPPGGFIKIAPVRPIALAAEQLARSEARSALGLDPQSRYALVMPGACQNEDMIALLREAAAELRKVPGLIPVIAHWPIAHHVPPAIDGAIIIERMPISPYYNAFDVIVSAAGYNSFHELVSLGARVVFLPQEDEGRDQQLARAQYAADQGWAIVCRKNELNQLAATVSSALNNPAAKVADGLWQQDWQPVLEAMHINSSQPDTINAPVRSLLDGGKLLHQTFAGWQRKHKTTSLRFVVALGVKEMANLPALLAPFPPQGNDAVVIVTDCIDPVLLRRLGYSYLWVNSPWLSSHLALRRQFLTWLHIWKPRAVINLVVPRKTGYDWLASRLSCLVCNRKK